MTLFGMSYAHKIKLFTTASTNILYWACLFRKLYLNVELASHKKKNHYTGGQAKVALDMIWHRDIYVPLHTCIIQSQYGYNHQGFIFSQIFPACGLPIIVHANFSILMSS